MDPLLSRPAEARVLHVDDDPAFGDLVVTYLEREDDAIDVDTVADPTVAVERLRDGTFDCVVSDYDMPGLDGLELLERLRTAGDDTPFVLFTGMGNEEIAAEAIATGVDAYLKKSGGASTFSLLAQRVRSLVDAAWAERRAEKAREVYEQLARVSSDAFWIRDMRTGETAYSEGIRQFGYEPGVRDDGFEWWLERVHPEDRETARDRNLAQQAGDPAGFQTMEGELGEFTFRYPWRHADGSYLDCLSRGVVRFEDGEGVEMVGAMTDLSEWRGDRGSDG